MSDLKMTAPSNKEFDPHPEGTFMAICRDVYIDRKPNPNAGQMNRWGNPEPDELVKVVFEFLTDEPIEINGTMSPRFVSYRANLSWHEDSNLRKFVRGWHPALGKLDDADIDQLAGVGAYLTIAHNVSHDGRTFANIVSAVAPPKGASFPQIPDGFVRRKDRQHEAAH